MEFPTIQQTFFVLFTSYLMKWLVPKLMKLMKGDKKEVVIHEKEWKKDVVYLYQYPRTVYTPNISPYCLKLETWLRANDIKYEVRPTWTKRSIKGQVPFIELNGEHLADTQLIIKALSRKFNKVNTTLTQSQMGIARAIDRLIECSFNHAVAKFRKVDNFHKLLSGETTGLRWMPKILTDVAAMLMKPGVEAKLYAVGFGRLTREEQIEQTRLDMQAIVDVMGKNKFILGDKPTDIDFTFFGHFASFYYLPFDLVPKKLMRNEFVGLIDLLDRLKEQFWPDWEDHLVA